MKTGLLFSCRKIVSVFLLVTLLVLTGCMSTLPSHYFLLSPIKDTAPGSVPDATKLHVIGVGPVKFPKYLNRSPIVRFSGKNELLIDEFNRWAEPLDKNFSRVLRTNLTRLLTFSYAMEYPWKRSMDVRFQVMIEVHQFETQANGNVNLSAHWVVLNLKKNKKVEVVRKFKYSQKLEVVNYDNIVAEQSKALDKLSLDIARELQKLLISE